MDEEIPDYVNRDLWYLLKYFIDLTENRGDVVTLTDEQVEHLLESREVFGKVKIADSIQVSLALLQHLELMDSVGALGEQPCARVTDKGFDSLAARRMGARVMFPFK